MQNDGETTIADDLLEGAAEIAKFLYGDPKKRRKVYHLASGCKENRLPVFWMGNILHGRKSTLLKWIQTQEDGPTEAA